MKERQIMLLIGATATAFLLLVVLFNAPPGPVAIGAVVSCGLLWWKGRRRS